MKIKITVDSTADFTPELLEKYDIKALPLFVNLGDKLLLDGVSINPEMIYEHVSKTKQLPKTSAVNSEQYKEYFKPIFDEGYDAIIHFNLSGEMSVTHLNAKMLMEEMPNLYVIDSRTLSTATALEAIYARELANTGKYTVEEIVKKVEERKENAQASFIIDRLDYLHKGGRCSTIALLGANLLHIKPSIEVHNGKMGVGKKYIGKYEKCVMKYVGDILQRYPNYDPTRVFITHTKIDTEIVENVKKYLKENTKFEEILETTAGATITSHCGPNTIGILFWTDGKQED
ncbi:MAG: DegV family protein [Clostridia bacterium]|nr:DegV family protein [Clostridia bacterium]